MLHKSARTDVASPAGQVINPISKPAPCCARDSHWRLGEDRSAENALPCQAGPDFDFMYHGSVSILTPLNKDARHWLESNIRGETCEFAGGIAIQHGYVDAILQGIAQEGMVVA